LAATARSSSGTEQVVPYRDYGARKWHKIVISGKTQPDVVTMTRTVGLDHRYVILRFIGVFVVLLVLMAMAVLQSCPDHEFNAPES
jgi:hypothetical protein